MSNRSGSAVLAAIAIISIGTAVVVGVALSHVVSGLIAGLLMGLGLVSVYSLLARLLGWPKLKWDDVWAIGHLLP